MTYALSVYCPSVCLLSAPEVASMRPYGHASDWWSLGILMFALLVGQVCSNTLLHCFSVMLKVTNPVYEKMHFYGEFLKICRILWNIVIEFETFTEI